jgi:peptide/nickel transport system substrate-binding protein
MIRRNGHLPRNVQRLAGVAAAVLASAAAFVATTTTAAAATSKPKPGGNLTFLIQQFPAGWESSLSSISSYEGNLWGEITDKLVYVADTGQISPWIATSWKQEDAARKFILNLKHGVTFSDGEPLNAQAVVDNINIWAKGDPTRGIAQVGLFPSIYFKDAKAVGKYTVEVDFYKPTLGFIPTLGYHGCILLSPKTLALPVTAQGDLSNEIGSGPFVVKSWTQGVSYTLVKRKDYNWGPPALGHTGPAYLNSITYKVIADDSTRESAVESGEAQVDFNVSPSDIPSLKSKGFQVFTPRYLGFADGFQVDAGVAPTNNLLVRQAIQHAINRAQILKTVYPTGWLGATSFVNGNVPEVADDRSLFAYNPALSEKDLKAAGYTKGSDGFFQQNGQDIDFNLVPNPYVPSTQQEDELIAQQFEKVGIKAQLQIVPLSSYTAFAQKLPLPPLLTVTRSFVDFSTVGGVLTSLNNGQNWFGVGTSDKTLDTLSKEIESAYSEAARQKLAAQVQKYVLNQGYFDPIVQQVQRIYLVSPKVQGIQFNGLAYANFYTAWIS